MSWDISLEAELGGKDRASLYGCEWNYTSNTNDMLREAGIELWEYAGKQAKDCITALNAGIQDMIKYPDKYDRMNPINGWGDSVGLVLILKDMRKHFEQYPLAYIRGSF